MNKFHLFLCTLLLVATSCLQKPDSNKAFLESVLQYNINLEDSSTWILLSMNGCMPCNKEIIDLLEKQMHCPKSYLRFAFTDFSSEKAMLLTIGNDTAYRKNVLLDRDGIFARNGLHLVYPSVFKIKNQQVAESFNLDNTRIIEFVAQFEALFDSITWYSVGFDSVKIQKYIDLYPKGIWNSGAIRRLDSLRQVFYYQVNYNNLQQLENYLILFPDGLFNDSVQARITELTATRKYGELTDLRNNHIYKTVTIGSQTWMAENLRYQIQPSWCYDENPAYCDTFGVMYDHTTALDACPEGWHLPSEDEWGVLVEHYGDWRKIAPLLRGKEYWHGRAPGLGTSEFNALPGGFWDNLRNYTEVYKEAAFLMSIDMSKNQFGIDGIGSATIYYGTTSVTSSGRTRAYIRCVKDSE